MFGERYMPRVPAIPSTALLALVLTGCVPAIGGVILYGVGGSSGGSAGPRIAFEAEWTFPPATVVVAGDLDGDQDIDLVFSEDELSTLRVYTNTGTRRAPVFTAGGTFGTPNNHRCLELYLADLDDDVDLDVVVIGQTNHVGRVWLNDGTGVFTDAAQYLDFNDAPHAAVVADVNGDGAPDIVTADPAGFSVWLNGGAASFVLGAGGVGDPQARQVEQLVAADLDGDGDVDLLTPVGGTGALLYWLNDGSGTFSANGSILLPDPNPLPLRVITGDIDRDGDLDLIGNTPSFDWFALNDGGGVFGPSWAFDRHSQRRSSGVADFDRDGYVDLVNAGSGLERVYLNVGHPSLVLAAAIPLPRVDTTEPDPGQLVVIDVNGDDKLDLVQAVPGIISVIFINKHGE
jgi:hypothetical protein